MHHDVHRVIVPSPWGYATLIRTTDTAVPTRGLTRRIDTLLPPDLGPDALLDFHARLLQRPGARRRPVTAAMTGAARRALRHAIDVRTTAALELHRAGHAPRPVDVTFAALVRAMRRAAHAHLDVTDEAMARQLVWCGTLAARDNALAQVLDAAHALRHLTDSRRAGSPPRDVRELG